MASIFLNKSNYLFPICETGIIQSSFSPTVNTKADHLVDSIQLCGQSPRESCLFLQMLWVLHWLRKRRTFLWDLLFRAVQVAVTYCGCWLFYFPVRFSAQVECLISTRLSEESFLNWILTCFRGKRFSLLQGEVLLKNRKLPEFILVHWSKEELSEIIANIWDNGYAGGFKLYIALQILTVIIKVELCIGQEWS